MTAFIERITELEQTLAIIVKAAATASETTFVTPSETTFQLGFVVYPTDGVIGRHIHRPIERRIGGTAEVLVVRQGKCEVDLYSDDRRLVATRELSAGDVILLLNGGHGFRVREDLVLLEIKQGPYTGLDEKERF